MTTEKSIWEMNSYEYMNHLQKKHELFLNAGGCPDCMGEGRIYEAGMFSKKYKCETCNGKGKLKKK